MDGLRLRVFQRRVDRVAMSKRLSGRWVFLLRGRDGYVAHCRIQIIGKIATGAGELKELCVWNEIESEYGNEVSLFGEGDDSADMFDLQFPSVLLVEVVGVDVVGELCGLLQQVDLFLRAFGDEEADDAPHGPVEDVGSQDVEGPEGFGVVVIEDGHELLHAFLGDFVRFGHIPAVVDDAQLVGLCIGTGVLASSASLTPFSIMYSR